MWPILLNTWNTSTLFVKKAAISFLATYFYSLGQYGKDEKLNGILEVSGLFKAECLKDANVKLTTNLFIYNRSNLFSPAKFTSLCVSEQLMLVLAEEANSCSAVENIVFFVASC